MVEPIINLQKAIKFDRTKKPVVPGIGGGGARLKAGGVGAPVSVVISEAALKTDREIQTGGQAPSENKDTLSKFLGGVKVLMNNITNAVDNAYNSAAGLFGKADKAKEVVVIALKNQDTEKAVHTAKEFLKQNYPQLNVEGMDGKTILSTFKNKYVELKNKMTSSVDNKQMANIASYGKEFKAFYGCIKSDAVLNGDQTLKKLSFEMLTIQIKGNTTIIDYVKIEAEKIKTSGVMTGDERTAEEKKLYELASLTVEVKGSNDFCSEVAVNIQAPQEVVESINQNTAALKETANTILQVADAKGYKLDPKLIIQLNNISERPDQAVSVEKEGVQPKTIYVSKYMQPIIEEIFENREEQVKVTQDSRNLNKVKEEEEYWEKIEKNNQEKKVDARKAEMKKLTKKLELAKLSGDPEEQKEINAQIIAELSKQHSV